MPDYIDPLKYYLRGMLGRYPADRPATMNVSFVENRVQIALYSVEMNGHVRDILIPIYDFWIGGLFDENQIIEVILNPQGSVGDDHRGRAQAIYILKNE